MRGDHRRTTLGRLSRPYAARLVRVDGRIVGCDIADRVGTSGPAGEVPCLWAVRDGPEGPVVRRTLATDHRNEDGERVEAGHVDKPALTTFVWFASRLASPTFASDADFAELARGLGLDDGDDEVRRTVIPYNDKAARAGEVVAAYVATLDPLALDHLRRRGMDDWKVAGAYAGLDGRITPGAPLRVAVQARPDFAHTLEDAWRLDRRVFDGPTDDVGLDAMVARACVVAARMSPRLARALPTAAGLVPGVRWDERDEDGNRVGDRRGFDLLVRYASRLDALPPNWVPTSREEWRGYLDCAHTVQNAMAWVDHRDLPAFLNAKGRWPDLAARLRKVAGIDADHVQALLDVGDMTDALARDVIAPALDMAGGGRRVSYAPRIAWHAVFDGRTLTRMLEDSIAWHAHAPRLAKAVRDAVGATPASWPAGLPDLVEDGTACVVLTDEDQLIEEGLDGENPDGTRGLAHCVGGYARSCVDGISRIVSVRGPDGARLATAEFRFEDGRPELWQFRGARNGVPCGEAEAALERYRGDLIVSGLRWRRADLIGTRGVAAAADPHERVRRWTVVRDLWDPHLPAHLRGLDAEGWRDAVAAACPMGREPTWSRAPFAFDHVAASRAPEPDGPVPS